MNLFILTIFLLFKVGLFFIAWIGEKILPFTPRFPYSDIYLIPSGLPGWIWSFANFDGVHYLTIAKQGYSAQFTQVFFPLYPLLISIAQQILGFFNPVVLGLFIANAFFLLSLFMLTKLLKLDYKKDTIRWILLFLIVFPTSFYFGSIYTESLFFFLVISAFYSARKKWWLLSGILGALASCTRLIGIFLLPALLWEWNQHLKMKNETFPAQGWSASGRKVLDFTFSAVRSPLSLIPVGLLSYMLYLQVKFGDWLYFWHAQPVFGAQRSGASFVLLPQVIWRYLKIFTSVSISSGAYFISLLEFISSLFALILIYIAIRHKVRMSYIIFSLLVFITPTLTGTFSSMPRYILMVFPILIVLGMLKSRRLKSILILAFTVILVILTLLFTRGNWVS